MFSCLGEGWVDDVMEGREGAEERGDRRESWDLMIEVRGRDRSGREVV